MGKEKEFRKCNNCKKKHLTKNLFCTRTCRDDFRFKETIKSIKRGELKDTNRGTIKKAVLRLYGHKCQICEFTEWQGQKIPLILDHIDGSHENNRLDNLRLVCPNCDAQLPTFKSKNRGKGRKNRTIEYYKAQLESKHGGHGVNG